MKEKIRKEVMKVFNQEADVDDVVDNILRLFDVSNSVCPQCKSEDSTEVRKCLKCGIPYYRQSN